VIAMEKFVLNSKEAATFLSISESTLFRLTAQKKLSKIMLSPKRVGWTKKELIRFTEKLRV